MGYSKGEEIANSITHGIGVIFSIVALTLMIVFASIYGNACQVVSVSIYGATLIILYTSSTLYHALIGTRAKKVFKIFDHASIYLLIAGTYTPFTLVILRQDGMIGWIIFGVIWGLAILGIILSSIFINKFRVLKTFLYILMGWMIVIALPNIVHIMSVHNAMNGVYLLVVGGILYTVGTIFYLFKNIKYFHSIWHLFVLAGTVCHFLSVFLYIL